LPSSKLVSEQEIAVFSLKSEVHSMDRAVLYYRVSTDEQVQSGAGLAAQRDACMRIAKKLGLKVVGEYQDDEGVSGETPMDQRPGLIDAVEQLSKGDTIVVAKRDRMARDTMKIAMFEGMLRTRKCRLISAAGEGTEIEDPNDPAGFLTRGIVDLFAQFELMMIRFRTRGALQAKRRRGERNGRIPYGWDLVDDGRRSKVKIDKKTGASRGGLPIALVENEQEQKALRLMLGLRGRRYSFGQIADDLNRMGIKTKAGKPWARSSVHYVLKVSVPLMKDHGQATTAAIPV
jgi:DNA invertase Pin-like site-specific DNA recombinase